MQFTPELVAELNTLVRFDLDTGQQGLKVHKTADVEVIAAFQRLHAKGLVTQVDGGYLTPFGMTMLEHLQHLLVALKPN